MITDAIERLRSEMGDWGSISMRLSDQQLSDILTIMDAAMSTASQPKGLRIEPAKPVKLEDPEGIYGASQPPVTTPGWREDIEWNERPVTEDAVERIIEHVSKYDVAEGDPRRRYTQAQMETAIRAAIQALSKDERKT